MLLLEKAALLRGCGVPVHLEEVPHVGAVPSHLYVLFDRHLDDAKALLQDASHAVSHPVYDDELNYLVAEVSDLKLSAGRQFLEALGVAVLLLMTVAFIAQRLFG